LPAITKLKFYRDQPNFKPELMDANKLIKDIQEIDNVIVTSDGQRLSLHNTLKNFKATIHIDEIEQSKFMPAPGGTICYGIKYKDGGQFLIASNDFVFDVLQDEILKVPNLPPIVPLSAVQKNFEHQQKSEISNNLDVELADFLFVYYPVKSALHRGIEIDFLTDLEEMAIKKGLMESGSDIFALFKK